MQRNIRGEDIFQRAPRANTIIVMDKKVSQTSISDRVSPQLKSKTNSPQIKNYHYVSAQQPYPYFHYPGPYAPQFYSPNMPLMSVMPTKGTNQPITFAQGVQPVPVPMPLMPAMAPMAVGGMGSLQRIGQMPVMVLGKPGKKTAEGSSRQLNLQRQFSQQTNYKIIQNSESQQKILRSIKLRASKASRRSKSKNSKDSDQRPTTIRQIHRTDQRKQSDQDFIPDSKANKPNQKIALKKSIIQEEQQAQSSIKPIHRVQTKRTEQTPLLNERQSLNQKISPPKKVVHQIASQQAVVLNQDQFKLRKKNLNIKNDPAPSSQEPIKQENIKMPNAVAPPAYESKQQISMGSSPVSRQIKLESQSANFSPQQKPEFKKRVKCLNLQSNPKLSSLIKSQEVKFQLESTNKPKEQNSSVISKKSKQERLKIFMQSNTIPEEEDQLQSVRSPKPRQEICQHHHTHQIVQIKNQSLQRIPIGQTSQDRLRYQDKRQFIDHPEEYRLSHNHSVIQSTQKPAFLNFLLRGEESFLDKVHKYQHVEQYSRQKLEPSLLFRQKPFQLQNQRLQKCYFKDNNFHQCLLCHPNSPRQSSSGYEHSLTQLGYTICECGHRLEQHCQTCQVRICKSCNSQYLRGVLNRKGMTISSEHTQVQSEKHQVKIKVETDHTIAGAINKMLLNLF